MPPTQQEPHSGALRWRCFGGHLICLSLVATWSHSPVPLDSGFHVLDSLLPLTKWLSLFSHASLLCFDGGSTALKNLEVTFSVSVVVVPSPSQPPPPYTHLNVVRPKSGADLSVRHQALCHCWSSARLWPQCPRWGRGLSGHCPDTLQEPVFHLLPTTPLSFYVL